MLVIIRLYRALANNGLFARSGWSNMAQYLGSLFPAVYANDFSTRGLQVYLARVSQRRHLVLGSPQRITGYNTVALRVTMKLEKEQWNSLVSKEFRFTLSVVVAQLVEVLRHKQESYEFDSRWYSWNFYLRNPFSHAQPLTEMSTRNISGGWSRTVHRVDKLITFVW